MPSAAVRILQISDLHTMNRQGALHGIGDVSARLATTLRLLDAVDPAPDAVLLSGDLIDRTSDGGYDEVLEFVDAITRTRACPVVPLMGNHDDRDRFDAALGHLNADETRRPGDAHDHVRTIGSVRLIALDSTVPGRSYGLLDEHQLAWLREVLSTPADGGTLLTLHHPPSLSPMPQLRYSGLHNADALADALADSDVRALLTGHFHHASASSWHGRLLWSAPALSYTQDVLATPPRIRGVDRGGFSLVDVSREAVTASVIDIPEPGDAAVLDYDLDIETKRTQWEEVHPVAPI